MKQIKKCPECLESIVTGNSYTRVLYKSFECKNPKCPARSKIGRGKRFDELSSKRQVMLERNSQFDLIDRKLYVAYRRDIIEQEDITNENLIKFYSWSGDEIIVLSSLSINNQENLIVYDGRTIHNKLIKFNSSYRGIKNLKIHKLFRAAFDSIEQSKSGIIKYDMLDYKSILINGNSSFLTRKDLEEIGIKSVSGAVTSPPYYNVREYSQWPSLYAYLIDMMINAKAVSNILDEKGVYIYNIGDIVDQDNVFIKSNMSKRRQMLGFFSVFIFDLAGFNLAGNIIWDKGEVQSKRNSTSNHMSGYLKPINSYEHCFVFTKQDSIVLSSTEVKKIDTVKKINSKGENIYGHTAPYPEGIPNLLIDFLKDKNGFVLDPFLGSGTTIKAMRSNNIKSVGVELNEEYYKLAKARLLKGEKDINDVE
ncbi:BslIM [Erysipelothrix rhusiopathiae SY1027]|uniref:DNA-methyltransferase n=1 Tax=Erysipelothrix rhusiopathiae TaxID=1648 RepID=UPI00033484F0|nr:site-specific DNA-methyltransferase [Erysipelothrix rhusiopathiae]AGN24552.1 BslIM [Erysipelothrix rhusiopathiae SY1027]